MVYSKLKLLRDYDILGVYYIAIVNKYCTY